MRLLDAPSNKPRPVLATASFAPTTVGWYYPTTLSH
jgi:hypothetical protein